MTHRPSQQVAIPDTPFTVRETDAGDISSEELDYFLGLLRRGFNGGPSWFFYGSQPRDHLEWKAYDFPATARWEILEEGDRVIGVQLQLRRRFLFDGRELEVRDGVDKVLEPEYQGRGLDTRRKNAAIALRDSPLSLDFGTHPLSRLRRGTVDDRVVPIQGEIQTLMKPLSRRFFSGAGRYVAPTEGTSRTAEILEQGSGPWSVIGTRDRLIPAARMAWSLLRNEPSVQLPAGISIRSVSNFDERSDEFFERAAGPFTMIQVRDQRYLNWRYADSRAGPFLVRIAEEGERLLGYAVVSVRADDAVLADVMCDPERPGVLGALLRDTSATAREAGAARLRAWLFSNHPYRAALMREGYVAYPSPLNFDIMTELVPPFDASALAEPDARIHLMTGDSDHV